MMEKDLRHYQKLRSVLVQLHSDKKIDGDMFDTLCKCVDDLEARERDEEDMDDGK